jgi:protein phosphatase
LKISAVTHPGMSGKNNEDRYGVSAYRLKTDREVSSVLAVVADGIGGHRAGEVAAELAVETISQAVSGSDGLEPVQVLEKAIVHASQLIHVQSETDPLLKGMGTTCACVWVM